MKFLAEFYTTLEKSVRAPYANQNQKSSFHPMPHRRTRDIFRDYEKIERTGGEEKFLTEFYITLEKSARAPYANGK